VWVLDRGGYEEDKQMGFLKDLLAELRAIRQAINEHNGTQYLLLKFAEARDGVDGKDARARDAERGEVDRQLLKLHQVSFRLTLARAGREVERGEARRRRELIESTYLWAASKWIAEQPSAGWEVTYDRVVGAVNVFLACERETGAADAKDKSESAPTG